MGDGRALTADGAVGAVAGARGKRRPREGATRWVAQGAFSVSEDGKWCRINDPAAVTIAIRRHVFAPDVERRLATMIFYQETEHHTSRPDLPGFLRLLGIPA